MIVTDSTQALLYAIESRQLPDIEIIHALFQELELPASKDRAADHLTIAIRYVRGLRNNDDMAESTKKQSFVSLWLEQVIPLFPGCRVPGLEKGTSRLHAKILDEAFKELAHRLPSDLPHADPRIKEAEVKAKIESIRGHISRVKTRHALEKDRARRREREAQEATFSPIAAAKIKGDKTRAA